VTVETADEDGEVRARPVRPGRVLGVRPQRFQRRPLSEPVFRVPPAFNVNNDRCGTWSRLGINARILSGPTAGKFGSETAFAEFPWHVALLKADSGEYMCAGALLSARYAVTVAHCVRKYVNTPLLVRVGDWDLSDRQEMLPSFDVQVRPFLCGFNNCFLLLTPVVPASAGESGDCARGLLRGKSAERRGTGSLQVPARLQHDAARRHHLPTSSRAGRPSTARLQRLHRHRMGPDHFHY